jgi:hypothetical protein
MSGTPDGIFKEGWLVVRMRPWEVRGLFTSKADADRMAREAGPGFEVKWGGMPVRPEAPAPMAKAAPQHTAAFAGDKPTRRPSAKRRPKH